MFQLEHIVIVFQPEHIVEMFQSEHCVECSSWNTGELLGPFAGGDDRRLLPRFTTFKQWEAIYEDWVV
jgi:hypothetical protein